MKNICLLLALLFLWGCSTIGQRSKCEYQAIRLKALKSIKIIDGIDAKEAGMLAREYFINYVSGCGDPGLAIDAGNHWVFHPKIGYAAMLMKDEIMIDKQTGTISFKGYPTIESPDKIFIDNFNKSNQKMGCGQC